MGAKKQIEIDGVLYESVTDACKKIGIKRDTINAFAWHKKISIRDAFYIYLHRVRDHKGNYFKSFTEMCAFHGISKGTFFYRLNAGLPIEMCLSSERWTGKSYDYVMRSK